MDTVVNGEVPEEPSDKEKVNSIAPEVTCDAPVCDPDDEIPNKNLPSDNAQSQEKDISNDLPHDTSIEKDLPQKTDSSETSVEAAVLNSVESNDSTHVAGKTDSNLLDTKTEEKCADGEQKPSKMETENENGCAAKEYPEKMDIVETSNNLSDTPVSDASNSDQLTVSSNAKTDSCTESLTSDLNSSKADEVSISPSKASDDQEVKDHNNFEDKSTSDSSKNTDSHEKLNENSHKISNSININPTINSDKEYKMCLESNPMNSEVVKNTNNCNSNPLQQLNEHIKSIGTNGSEILNTSTTGVSLVEDSETSKSECSKTCNKDCADRHKDEADSFVFTEVSKEETGFPEIFAGLVVVGKYISVKGDFTLRSTEALVESPSLIAPYLLKEPDTFPPRANDSKLEQKDFFHSTAGEMLIGIGLGRVSEWYHRDMTRIKKRLMKKEGKSPQLEEDLKLHETFYNESRKANKMYNFPLKTCGSCGFATESSIVMEGHLLVPHVNMRREYQCNFCDAFNRDPKAILEHMYRIHGKSGRIQPPVLFFECPYCTFESNSKVKLGNHLPKCQRFYDPNRNQAPPKDFEFPALTPKPITVAVVKAYEKSLSSMQRGRGRPKKIDSIAEQLNLNHYASLNNSPMIPNAVPSYRQSSTPGLSENLSSITNQMMTPPMSMPNMNLRPTHSNMGQLRPGLPSPMHLQTANRFYPINSTAQLLPMLGNNPLMTSPGQFPYNAGLLGANNMSKNTSMKTPTSSNQFINSFFPGGLRPQNPPKSVPEVTITPLPKLHGPYPVPMAKPSNAPLPSNTMSLSSSSSSSCSSPSSQSNNLVVCEICDGYIKDLEQLRSHMQLIHKVKIHPKMLVSRPPLNCQKCQWRFFTDQGLERHLLGSHGLVTSNMQELANKNKDAGCCTICGRVYASKLVSHMNQVHKLTLKPAHLSYKCTVCSATFNLYRLFENHVYLVHSGAAKRPADGGSNPSKKFKSLGGDNNGMLNDGEPKSMENFAKCAGCGCDFRKHAAQIDRCEKCLKYDGSQGTLNSKMS